MSLRDKYTHGIQTAKGLGMDGSAEERDGKLHFRGTVGSEEEANKIWDALKTVPDWRNDVVADITVKQNQTADTGGSTYTVQAGDTLSGIAKKHLGDGNAYMKIFDANKDVLSDPDKITPGQVLKMPSR